MQSADLIIIGGGLIGLATAYYASQTPQRIILLEKEPDIAQHQSGGSWSILEVGARFEPTTRAAYHLRYGVRLLRDFCEREKIEIVDRSLLYIAADVGDLESLHEIKRRALAGGISVEFIENVRAIEPHSTGIAGLLLPESGLFNPQAVARRLALRFEMAGGRIRTNQRVVGLQERGEGVIVQTKDETWIAQHVVNVAGLYADRLADKIGVNYSETIIPFRGEQFLLKPQAAHLCHNIILPTANLELPFNGIGLTRTHDGTVFAGTNAVMAGGREQRRKGQISLRTSAENLFSPAVRKLTRRHLQNALWEQRRSFSRELFALTLQRLIPAITKHDLQRTNAGTQPFAINADGTFVNDFVFAETARSFHVLSVANGGATAGLSIGRTIAAKFASHQVQNKKVQSRD